MNQGQTNYKLVHIKRIPFFGNYSLTDQRAQSV